MREEVEALRAKPAPSAAAAAEPGEHATVVGSHPLAGQRVKALSYIVTVIYTKMYYDTI